MYAMMKNLFKVFIFSWSIAACTSYKESQSVQTQREWSIQRNLSLLRGGITSGATTSEFVHQKQHLVGSKSSSKSISTCKSNEEKEYKKALLKTALTVTAATVFGIGISVVRGTSSGYEFFAGYLIEQSLSIDNIFVFIMLFDYFQIPLELQNRVLTWGITGAIVLRGIMISLGVAVLQRFQSVILVFAGILLVSSVNLLLEKDDDGKDDETNMVMKLTKVLLPSTTSELHGEEFFIKDIVSGKYVATPLFLCLVCVELSDFVFAVDSIPAVLGVSKDPLIVYASNIFAILALRSLYTVVARAIGSFYYLKSAVALVLGFVGLKMICEYFHYHIDTGLSLAVICSFLGSGILASILRSKKEQVKSLV
jgi:TerC family integral membrane protein